jgi:hypothetical protein
MAKKSLHEVAREYLKELRREKEQRGERFEYPDVQPIGVNPRPTGKQPGKLTRLLNLRLEQFRQSLGHGPARLLV